VENMRVALAATIFFIVTVIVSGSLTIPTYEDLALVLSSFIIVIMSWIYTKEKGASKADNKKVKDNK
jgi:uncharacterized membrane protein YoaK (UPF0700 family)